MKLESLGELSQGSVVTPQSLLKMGAFRNLKHPVKVLGNGEIGVALTVNAHKFTRSARDKIEAAGGRAGVI